MVSAPAEGCATNMNDLHYGKSSFYSTRVVVWYSQGVHLDNEFGQVTPTSDLTPVLHSPSATISGGKLDALHLLCRCQGCS